MKQAFAVLMLAVLFLSPCSLRSQESQSSGVVFARVDSLLLAKDYQSSRTILQALTRNEGDATAGSTSDRATAAEYLPLIDRLEAAPGLPDSLTRPIVDNVRSQGEKFSEFNAGSIAHRAHEECLGFASRSLFGAAYERYVLAEFLRLRHVRQERSRLVGNLVRTREAMRARDFKLADTLLTRFRTEPPTLTFSVLHDSLARFYDPFERDIQVGLGAQTYESGRVNLDKRIQISAGATFIPSVAVAFSEIQFNSPSTPTPATSPQAGNAFSVSLFGYNVEAGYFITPSLVVGIAYSAASAVQEQSMGTRLGTPVGYKGEIQYQAADVFVKYLLDRRVGPRPYLTLTGGRVESRLLPQTIPGDPLGVAPVEVTESGPRVGAELGLDYVPFTAYSICLTAFTNAHLNLMDKAAVAKKSQFQLGVRAGYLF